MDPEEGVKLDIYCIAAEGLSKARPHYAKVSVVCGDLITKWTTPVDEEGGNNPKWEEERTMTYMHQKDVYVVVKIYRKGVVKKCVGEVSIPVSETIDYEIERFLLVRSKYQLKNPRGAIKLSCQIRATAAPAPAAGFAQQATPVAPAFSDMTSQGPPVTPSVFNYGPPGGFPAPVNYQQNAPGFGYPQPYPGYNYQPMPQQPPGANGLGVGGIAPLVMMGANLFENSLSDVIPSDFYLFD